MVNFTIASRKLSGRAAELDAKHHPKNQFEIRIDGIIRGTSAMGRGFHDFLSEIFQEHFGASA